ncbi:MAG: tetratricopeptide repeat protein [Chlorobiaceae bacterium]|nr:tetratricopeptide repeat protein [Chlorobiaceae bacterium]
MYSRIGKLSAYLLDRRRFFSFVLSCAIFPVIFLSSCSTRPVLSGKLPSDSLAEATKREFVAATLLCAKEEYRGAADCYQKLLTVDPSNAAIHYALSKAYAGLGAIDSARFYSEKSVLLNPGNKYYLSFLAAIAHQMHDYSRAADLYRQLAALEQGSAEPLSYLALEYLAAEQPEKALAVFQEILAIDPKDKTAQAQVLLMEIKLLHYHDAISTVMELIEQGNDKDKLSLTLGELYMQTRQYDLAVKAFREVLHENPRFLPAWLALFEVSVQSNNRPVFLEDLNRFYNTHQVSLEQKIDLAKLFVVRSSQDSSFVEPSFAMIDEINKHYPNNSNVYALRGNIKLLHGQEAASIADFKKSLLLDSGNIDIWEDLVAAYLTLKEYRQAEKTVSIVIKRFPTRPLRFRALEGEVCFQTGSIKKAVLLLEKVVQPQVAKKDKQTYLQAGSILALCYDKLGLPAKSIRLYDAILDIDAGNVFMMNNLAYLLAVQGKELSRAKELALKAVAAEPENASYLDTLGWVLFKLGEYDKSCETLEKAAGINTREPEILDHLFQAYEKLGNPEKAHEMNAKMKKLQRK